MAVWEPAELVRFREVADADERAAGWRLTLCGLRRSEALGLSWDAVDLDRGEVTVKASRVLLDGDTRTVTDDPKSSASWGTVPVEESHPAWVLKSSPVASAGRGSLPRAAVGDQLGMRASLHMVLGTHRTWGNQLLELRRLSGRIFPADVEHFLGHDHIAANHHDDISGCERRLPQGKRSAGVPMADRSPDSHVDLKARGS